MKEDEIAALDGDWSQHTPAQRAAYNFARKITVEPHRWTDADHAELRKHYTDLQILEMVMSTAGNNAINRWKEGAGIPQSSHGGGFGRREPGAPEAPREPHTYETPTSDKFKSVISNVVPFSKDEKHNGVTAACVFQREPLESRAEVEKALEACAHRKPRLPLVDEAKTRELLADAAPKGPLPQWMRLMANFPRSGKSRIASQQSAETKGDLSPLLKAQVSWIIARQDRAWYALGLAKQRLKALGQTDDQIYALDGDWSNYTPAERAMFTVARELAASPIMLTEAQAQRALKLTSNRDVVQMINYVTVCASFNRITEAAGLQLEK